MTLYYAGVNKPRYVFQTKGIQSFDEKWVMTSFPSIEEVTWGTPLDARQQRNLLRLA
jgi:hypothetical protein